MHSRLHVMVQGSYYVENGVGRGEFPKIVDNFGECTGKPYVWDLQIDFVE